MNLNPKVRKHNCVIARLEKGLKPLDKCPICGKKGKIQKLDKKALAKLTWGSGAFRRAIEEIVKKKIPLNKPIEELLNDEIDELLKLFHSFCKEIIGELKTKKYPELDGTDYAREKYNEIVGYNRAIFEAKDEQIKRLEEEM